ncbi:SPATS2-like protein isoform X2 [Tiliqua scincoides]|uniref:SPATS2-like protein isoform X2 n=1 Tax=Tiliqua scincoides TaxID=71010 RepID=UPI00346297F1
MPPSLKSSVQNSKRKRSKSKQHCSKDMKDKDDGEEKVSLESQEPNDCHLMNCCDKETLPSKPVSEKSRIKEEKSLECKDMRETKPYITDKKEGHKKISIDADHNFVNSTELPDTFQTTLQSQCNVGRMKAKPPAVKSPVSATHLEIKPGDSVKKRGPNIEKSVKDLQRCTVSLTRYRMMIKEEVDNSVKKIKAAFAELHSCIIDREVGLMAEVDKVKEEAMEILTARQKKAEELKRLTDLASQMAETQLAELRAEIKHFVSERKYDEELGRSARFSCDIEQLKTQIQQCGEIFHPKNNYSSRTPPSTLLQSATLHTATSIKNTYVRKPSSRAKTPDSKATMPKASGQVVTNATESSPQIISTNKQNGSSNQKRRFHAHYHDIRLNGSLKSQSTGNETDQNMKSNSRHEYRRQHHNSFRPKNKGSVKTQEQPTPAKSMEHLTYPEKARRKYPMPGPTEPRPLCGNIARVSQCNLCPPRIEASTDAPVLSVPAVTLVA